MRSSREYLLPNTGEFPHDEDVEAQRGSSHKTHFEHIQLDGIPFIDRGDTSTHFSSKLLVQRWDWIKGNCERKEDLIPLQRRMIAEAFLALVSKKDEALLLDIGLAIRSVRCEIESRLEELRKELRKHRWWKWRLQVLTAGRSQQRLLEVRLDQIQYWLNIIREALEKLPHQFISGDFEKLEFFKPPDVRRVPDIPVEDADILLKETLEKIRVKRKRAGISLREILKNVLDDREEKHRIDRNRPSSSNSDYIVVASQLESSNGCREKLLKIKFGSDVFKDLRKGINGFRGWRGFFSLKSLKAFGIFKCDTVQGRHYSVLLSPSQKFTLSQLFVAYSASGSDEYVTQAWGNWIYENLNGGSHDPLGNGSSKSLDLEGDLSLELIYSWSALRLSFVVAVPLLLSLAIGIWYMKATGDVVGAWTVSLYVVTSAAAVVALLAIIGSLRDIRTDGSDSTGGTPYGNKLVWGAAAGDKNAVERLLVAGADANYKSASGRTLLSCAAANGHEAVVELLLKKKAEDPMALYEAAVNGHERVVELLLLEKWADVNAANSDQQTALHKAAEYGYENIVRLLLDKGAEMNKKDRGEHTALFWAVDKRNGAIIKLLLEKGNKDVTDSDRQMALYWAVMNGQDDVVELLLGSGADVNMKYNHGQTALHWAAQSGFGPVVKLLVGSGADVNVRDDNGHTALHWAAQGGVRGRC